MLKIDFMVQHKVQHDKYYIMNISTLKSKINYFNCR
jgi:hypothetical protein